MSAFLKYLSIQFYQEFWFAFLGQTLAGISQLGVLTMPPVLAAKWFASDEVSTACALGVFANQLGTAIGFFVPPLFKDNLKLLFALGAVVTAVLNGVGIF